jgi:integrase/transcriptional regulator with XRE-family HTH domain
MEESRLSNFAARPCLRHAQTLGERLAEQRRRRGLSQVLVAARLGRPQSVISRWEAAERAMTLAEFVELARLLELDPDQVLAGTHVLRERRLRSSRARGREERLAVGLAIARTRTRATLDPVVVARGAGLSPYRLWRIEGGVDATLFEVVALARALSVSPSEFIGPQNLTIDPASPKSSGAAPRPNETPGPGVEITFEPNISSSPLVLSGISNRLKRRIERRSAVPVTKFTVPLRGLVAPDYERALRRLDKLPYLLGDPRRAVAAAVVRRGKTDQSAKAYSWLVSRGLSWFASRGIDPLAATTDDLQMWWNSLADYSPLSRNAFLVGMRAFYIEAVDRELIAADPTRKLVRDKAIALMSTPALTRPETLRLLAAIDEECSDPARELVARRDAVLIGFALRLCMRLAEVQSLRWSCLSVRDDKAVVSFIGKGRKPATLDVPPPLVRRLEAWRAALEESIGQPLEASDPIIVSLAGSNLRATRRRRRGQPMKQLARSDIFTTVRDRLAQVGVVGPRMGPHALRATGATLAYEGGADLVACQNLLRHESIETTRRFYLKRLENKASEAIERMGLDDAPDDDDALIAKSGPLGEAA